LVKVDVGQLSSDQIALFKLDMGHGERKKLLKFAGSLIHDRKRIDLTSAGKGKNLWSKPSYSFHKQIILQ